MIATLAGNTDRQPGLVKTIAGIIIAAMIGLFALWSSPADAHGMHMDATVAVQAATDDAKAAQPAGHCDMGHSCHLQILPAALPDLRHHAACFSARLVMQGRLTGSFSLVTDPPPPRV
jgi:hypothetical protein